VIKQEADSNFTRKS